MENWFSQPPKQYRKSPWRYLFGAMALYGGSRLVGIAAIWLFPLLFRLGGGPVLEAASVGIIGGADGPTAIFLTTSAGVPDAIIPVLLLVIGIWGFLRLSKCPPEKP